MEQQTTTPTYADGYKAGYQDAKAFYTRRDNHARTVARQTMKDVREAMGLNY